MTNDIHTYGRIAALEYRERPPMDFADIVEEFDIAFQLVDSPARQLIWENDNIAFVDRDCVRVALGWLPPADGAGSWHLVFAVGDAPKCRQKPPGPEVYDYLTERVVERTRTHLPFDSILRGEASRPIGAALITSVFELLRLTAAAAPDVQKPQRSRAHEFPEIIDEDEDTASAFLGGDDARPFYYDPAEDIGYIDQDLLPKPPSWLTRRAEPTQPMRLTIHAVALSLMIYTPPLGAFMFAYTMLRDITTLTT